MVPRSLLAGVAGTLAVSMMIVPARAEVRCGPKITRATVVPCALAASFAVRRERHGVEAARARETAAAVLLPSNPQLALSVSARSADPGQRATNWSASLSQEIAIAGQRGARLDVARAEIDAEEKRAALSERQAAAQAWLAYFGALAARDELALSDRLAGIARGLAASVGSRAEQGLAAPIDADLAYAASVRAIQARAGAERRLSAARAALAFAVGAEVDAAVQVEGDLSPLPLPDAGVAALARKAISARAEIGVARADQKAHEHRASLLRRARVPNITLSVGIANDGFHERVVTGGIAFPIPLPGPLGRTYAGEIAEAAALARRAGAEVGRLTRRIQLDVTTAAEAYASRRAALDAFDAKRIARAEESLRSLADELSAGRITVRDALLAQQGLVELMQAHVEAKHALCVASVDLLRAAGVALERGAS